MSTHEHSEHIAHAGGHGHDDGKKSNFGMYVGITMACLGVLLAFCAARVGAERTELVKGLVEQQNAHAKYQAQDVKHRVAFLSLQTLHASIATGARLNKPDVLAIANTVDRYLEESKAAKEWVESYEPAIEVHVEGQEHYELGQLLAEIGIVIASVALLLKQKVAWVLALLLGAGAITVTIITWRHGSAVLEAAEAKIAATGKAYRDLRTANKTTSYEEDLTKDIRAWAATPDPVPAEVAPAAPATPAPARDVAPPPAAVH